MKASEVKNCLKIVAEVKLGWEDISGGVVHVNSNELVQVEERLKQNMGEKLEKMEKRMRTFVQGEIAKVKAKAPIPECPVCFYELKPPKKIVQCLKVGVHMDGSSFPKKSIVKLSLIIKKS